MQGYMAISLVLVFFIVGVLFAHRAAQVFSFIVYNVGSEQEEVAMDLGKVWVRPPVWPSTNWCCKHRPGIREGYLLQELVVGAAVFASLGD